MGKSNKKRLGDILIDTGKISKATLEKYLEKQKISGQRLGEILIDEGALTEEDILQVLEFQLGLTRVYLEFTEIKREAVQAIPESLAIKHNLIPISIEDKKINVAMSDPLNIFALDDIKITSGKEPVPMLVSNQEVKNAISKYYSPEFVRKAADELTKEQKNKNELINTAQEIETINDFKDAPVVRLVDSIIDNAVKTRASDIHIEPYETYIKIRYRIDGQLQEVLKSPIETLGALTTRIKILADLNIAEKRLPQDGRILTKVENKNIDLRVSVLPTVFGEKIVIRILKRDSYFIKREDLGMDKDSMKKLNNIIKSPYGIILLTGPTGSGKSTTLYSILSELNTSNKNIITIEDPVEYMIEGINQVNVNTKAGLTFAAGLRSMLRQDPDIIMVGEMRDSETAEIAIRAAITGHLVLSTIHTNDSSSTVTRLVDMGIEPFLLASSFSGIIAQRLVRKICPRCFVEYEASNYEKKLINIDTDEHVKLFKGTGCPYCNNTGYRGRVGVYEVMEITKTIRELILKEASSDEIKERAILEGMKTLAVSCRELLLKGVTTIEEYMKIAYVKVE